MTIDLDPDTKSLNQDWHTGLSDTTHLLHGKYRYPLQTLVMDYWIAQ